MARTRILVAGIVLVAAIAQAQLLEVCTVDHRGANSKEWVLSCTPTPVGRKLAAPFSQVLKTPQAPGWQICDAPLVTQSPTGPIDATSLSNLKISGDYTITAQGSYVFLVSYPAGAAPPKNPNPSLPELNKTFELLLSSIPAPQPFSVEIVVPHARALGGLVNQIATISSTFQAKLSGTDRVVVTTPNGLPPSCEDWKTFQRDLRQVVWSVHPEPFEFRLTALDATSTASALGAAAPASPSTEVTSGSSSKQQSAQGAPALTITVTPAASANSGKASGGNGNASGSGASGGNGTSASAGVQATTISVAPSSSTPPTAAPSPGPAGVAANSTPGVSVAAISPDLLVFSDTNPGDDGLITEKKRIAAVLDLPRPELSISAWVMQNSSTDPRSVSESSRLVREEVHSYNDGLEASIFRGWQYLKQATATPSYFDVRFYNYLTRRVVFDGFHSRKTLAIRAPTYQRVNDVLSEDSQDSDQLSASPASAPAGRSRQDYLGFCAQEEYCLGYTTLFDPLKPRVTDLLLAIVAAKDPVEEVDCVADWAENTAHWALSKCKSLPAAMTSDYNVSTVLRNDPASPEKIWKELTSSDDSVHNKLPINDPHSYEDCEKGDYLGTLQSMVGRQRPTMFLNCFRQKLKAKFKRNSPQDPVSELGLIRSSIADFLFNYKMSQQYPHEFVPYDLIMSAQTMNTALRPLVDAFLQDVAAYQAVLKRRLGLQIEDADRHLTYNSWFDKPRFFNNAIVKVDTIANSEATVDTATESYLEALNPPTLSGMANALLGTQSTTAAQTGSTALTGLLSAPRLNELQAIVAGLSQFQSSRIHLGRELSVDVKAETLLGASSAELQVTLKADDEGSSGAYSSGPTGDAEVSRFSKGDTTTRVRVDSLKLFEVSSFASQLVVPKKRFPILPLPGLEMPYFGSIISLPLRPGREFHSSLAVLSAVVIPTAADLAYTARFFGDRILVGDHPGQGVLEDDSAQCFWPTESRDAGIESRGPCKTRPMISLRDFNGMPVREFNRMMVHCLATGGQSAIPTSVPLGDPKQAAVCGTLTFRDVLGDID